LSPTASHMIAGLEGERCRCGIPYLVARRFTTCENHGLLECLSEARPVVWVEFDCYRKERLSPTLKVPMLTTSAFTHPFFNPQFIVGSAGTKCIIPFGHFPKRNGVGVDVPEVETVIVPLKAGDFLSSKSFHHRADHHVGEGRWQRIDRQNRIGEGNTGLVAPPISAGWVLVFCGRRRRILYPSLQVPKFLLSNSCWRVLLRRSRLGGTDALRK